MLLMKRVLEYWLRGVRGILKKTAFQAVGHPIRIDADWWGLYEETSDGQHSTVATVAWEAVSENACEI